MPEALKDYFEEVRRGKQYPTDPFQHASSLTDTEQDKSFDKHSFSRIVGKQILLSNIADDKLMRFLQNDVILLTSLYDMARREQELESVFFTLYYGWRGELLLTRAKDGIERKLQGTVGTGYSPDGMRGYEMDDDDEEDINFLEKAFSQMKKGGGNKKWKK
jgi:hypothetical protein